MKDIDSICEYLHLPLQSGADNILKKMNRKYTYESYKEKILKTKEQIPGIAVSSDFIVGFPGETEADFEKSLSALREIEYESVFAFKYSPRPGTTAAEFEDSIPEEEKNRRLNKLLNVQSEITSKLLEQYIGKVCEVLVEGKSKMDVDIYSGRNRQNRIINFNSNVSLNPGDIVNVKVTEAKKNSLFGTNINEFTLITNNRRQ
jgi:tRNA-2-methylthio-N6-dimethylallyladenosine synthase